MKKEVSVNEIFENKGAMEAMDTQKDNATVDSQLEKKAEPVEVPVLSLMDMLNEARVSGLVIKSNCQYSDHMINMHMSVIYCFLSEGVVRTVEVSKNDGKIMETYILGNDEVSEKIITQLNESSPEEITIIPCKYGRVKEDDTDKIDALFKKLGWEQRYHDYRKQWLPDIPQHGNKTDIERIKESRKIFDNVFPAINEEGHLLLTEDSLGNQILACASRCNETGQCSFDIYRRGHDGKIGKTSSVSASDATNMNGKVRKLVENMEGNFTSQAATEAEQRLWLWSLSKNYEYLYEDMDDLSVDDIYDLLKDWVNKNVCKEWEEGGARVFAEQIKGDYKVGIWAEDLEKVFKEELEISMKPKEWISNAAKHKWIILNPARYEKGTTDRTGYTPSKARRLDYMRVNKSERLYILALSQDEAKRLCTEKKKAENLIKQNIQTNMQEEREERED